MTSPIDDFIPEPDQNVQRVLNYYSNGLRETVNFGSHIISWDANSGRSGDESLPPILLLRHIIELLNAGSVLISKSSIDPCKIIARGIVESFFSLAYMLENDCELRSICFLTWHYHQKLKLYKKIHFDKKESDELKAKLKKDISADDLELPRIPKLDFQIENLESLLSKPKYQEVYNELLRLVESGERNPKWYRLYNGPKNIEQLSEYLKMPGLYELYYRQWSGSVHGTEIIQGIISSDEKGQVQIMQINFPKEAQAMTNSFMILALKTYRYYLDNRLPERRVDLTNWYKTIRNFFLKIGEENILKFDENDGL